MRAVDAAGLFGVCFLGAGLWLMHPSLALCAAGCGLIAWCVVNNRHGKDTPQ